MEKEMDIKIFRNTKNKSERNPNSKGGNTEERKLYDKKKRNFDDEKYSEEYDDNYPRYKMSQMQKSKNSQANLNFRYKNRDYDMNESIGTNMEDVSSEDGKYKRSNAKVENSFNILEIIVTQFFKCCMCENMKVKNEANERANEIMFKQMDIITFVRNMLLFDIINHTLVDNNKRKIINFLSRPVININNKTRKKYDEFYENYREKDFNKYYDNMIELAQKPQKEEREMELVTLSNEHLRDFM